MNTWERIYPPENYHRRRYDALDDGLDVRMDSLFGNNPDLKAYMEERRRTCWYDDRNYELFAILANVRNGVGFAGVPTGDPVNYIVEPRGLPDDMGEAVAVMSEDEENVGLGYHDHSWLTLYEIVSFDWEQVSQRSGWVDAESFKYFQKHHKPWTWCGDILGGDTKKVSQAEMIEAVADGRADGMFTNVDWVETYRDCAGDNWWIFVDTIFAMIGPTTSSKDIRVVFGFDS